MATIELTEDTRWTIINALNTAAETYEADANKITSPGFSTQFRKQASQARNVARWIEQSS